MTRAFLILWIIVQINADARPARCWPAPGLELQQTTLDGGPQWVGQDRALLGKWLMAVPGRSVAEAAGKIGLRGCDRG